MKFSWINLVKALALLRVAGFVAVAVANEDPASALLQEYSLLQSQLQHSQFKQPVVLDSTETGSLVTGEIHAVIKHPFAIVRAQLDNPDHWCDVLSLHLNTKYCRAVVEPPQTVLNVNFGKKTPQDLRDVARIAFIYTSEAATASYLNIKLAAEKGVMGTSNFHIEFEAVPLPDGNTFLHFTYSYSISRVTRFALKTYLATIGRNKPGFTITGSDRDGQPQFISGVRGIMERNTMRYYVAIDSFFAATPGSPQQQLEQRLQSWYSGIEEYPLQLHDLERDEYLSMKRAEYQRQQTED